MFGYYRYKLCFAKHFLLTSVATDNSSENKFESNLQNNTEASEKAVLIWIKTQ